MSHPKLNPPPFKEEPEDAYTLRVLHAQCRVLELRTGIAPIDLDPPHSDSVPIITWNELRIRIERLEKEHGVVRDEVKDRERAEKEGLGVRKTERMIKRPRLTGREKEMLEGLWEGMESLTAEEAKEFAGRLGGRASGEMVLKWFEKKKREEKKEVEGENGEKGATEEEKGEVKGEEKGEAMEVS